MFKITLLQVGIYLAVGCFMFWGDWSGFLMYWIALALLQPIMNMIERKFIEDTKEIE